MASLHHMTVLKWSFSVLQGVAETAAPCPVLIINILQR